MPRRSTTADRKQAQKLLRDTRDLERRGARAATRIGTQARLDVLRAWRAGRDPAAALTDSIRRLTPLLTDAMVTAHLQGRRRSAIEVAPVMRGRQTIKLAGTVYDRALAFLKQRIDVTDDDLAAIERLYVPRVDRQVQKLADAARRKILTTMHDLTRDGAGVRKGVVELGKAMEAAGVTPQQSHTLEAIFRTETQTAYSAGRWNALKEPDAWDALWGFKYVTAADFRVRPTHAAMDGVTLPKDDPFWQTSMPPNGWNCRCQAIELFGDRSRVDPSAFDVDGVTVEPVPDRGFEFNAGEQFRDVVEATPQRQVGQFLNVQGGGKAMQVTREVIQDVERVHNVASMPSIPVKTSAGTKTLGVYHHMSDGKPVDIRVSRNSPRPRMTAAHEIGHFIDHQAIGTPGQFASETHASMQAFREAARKTAAYGKLERVRDTHASAVMRNHARYMLRDREVFARGYAQFIAQRSGDRTMRDELAAMIKPTATPYQWSERDFRPIERAIEQVLKDLKWLK